MVSISHQHLLFQADFWDISEVLNIAGYNALNIIPGFVWKIVGAPTCHDV